MSSLTFVDAIRFAMEIIFSPQNSEFVSRQFFIHSTAIRHPPPSNIQPGYATLTNNIISSPCSLDQQSVWHGTMSPPTYPSGGKASDPMMVRSVTSEFFETGVFIGELFFMVGSERERNNLSNLLCEAPR